MRPRWIPFALLLFAVGCASPENHVKVAAYDSATRAKSERVDVIPLGSFPDRQFKILALLTYEGHASDETKAERGIIERAKQLGADGVVMIAPDAPNKNLAFKSGWAGPSPSYRIFRAHAIAYR